MSVLYRTACFQGESSLICSQETFEWLTGISDYSLVGIQTEKNVPEETIEKISSMTGSNVIFTDNAGRKQTGRGYLPGCPVYCLQFPDYHCYDHLFLYCQQYFYERVSKNETIWSYAGPDGMDTGQLTRMILAEALTYSVSGLIVGYAAGILVSRFLYIRLITRYFGNNWELPVNIIIIAAVFDLFSAAASRLYSCQTDKENIGYRNDQRIVKRQDSAMTESPLL